MPTCITERFRRRRFGFTLVELLVVIGVVSILLAVTLPAIGGARRSARVVEGQSHLRQVMTLHAGASASNGGSWVTAFERDVEFANLVMGNTLVCTPHVLTQAELWAIALLGEVPAPLLGDRYVDHETAQIVTAPAVYRAGAERFAVNPQAGGAASYLYSPALFTDDALWDPAAPERRSAPDRYRRRVGLHDVRFPSEKAAMVDRADHSESGVALEASAGTTARFNVGFADGSVRRLSVGRSGPVVSVAWPEDEVDVRGAVPFVSTAHGSSGRDL